MMRWRSRWLGEKQSLSFDPLCSFHFSSSLSLFVDHFFCTFFFSLLTPHQFVHCLWAVLLFFFRFITFPTSPTHICDSRAAIFVNYKFSPITARLSVGANQSQKEQPPSSIVQKIKRGGLGFETATKQSI